MTNEVMSHHDGIDYILTVDGREVTAASARLNNVWKPVKLNEYVVLAARRFGLTVKGWE